MSQHITDEMILTAIDRGFSALGDSPKQAIWYCLENDFKFDRNKVPENLEAFEETLKRFFGLGYSFLETLLLHYLCEVTGEKSNGQSFSEYVSYLREKP